METTLFGTEDRSAKVKNSEVPHCKEILFATEPMKLRTSVWCGVVYRHSIKDDVFITYLYKDGDRWVDMTEHPKYNPHNGTTNGLPASLRKLYSLRVLYYEYSLEEAYEKFKKEVAA